MRNVVVVVAENSWEEMFSAAGQNMCWNSQDSLDLQGSSHTGGDAVHTGLILAATMVENKRKAPQTDRSFLMGHIHYHWRSWFWVCRPYHLKHICRNLTVITARTPVTQDCRRRATSSQVQ